jgi:hypothetical protein
VLRLPACGALVAAIALSACAEGQQRDNTGQALQMRPVAAGDAAGFPLNVSAFLPATALSDFQRSERDGQAAYVDTLKYAGMTALRYEWLGSQLIFAARSYRELASRDTFEARLASAGIPHVAGKGEIAPVRHARYPSVGFTYVGPGRTERETCFFGTAGYGVRVQSSETQGLETADAVLTGGLCGAGLDAAAFVRFFNGFTATAP